MIDEAKTFEIGNKKYTFLMTNKTIRKIDEKYGNYGTILYGILEGEQFFTNCLKLISQCCIQKDWTIEELEEKLTGEQYQNITTFAVELYLDYMGYNEESNTEENTEVKKKKKEQ